MAKEVAGLIKLQIRGGAANPSPPVGPAGKLLPVIITVFSDKSFDFIVKTPPVAVQLLEAAKVKKGSPESNREKVASVTWQQVQQIAKDKMPDLNAFTVKSAMQMVAGTARSMGITVQGDFPSNL